MKTSLLPTFVAAFGLLAVSSTSALATVVVSDTGTTNLTRTAGYFSGNGGEFTLTPTSGPVSNLSYVQAATAGSGTFQSFCIEYNEYTASPLDYFVNSGSVMGGLSGGSPFDRLSVTTTVLYSQFATGVLAYDYTPGAGRAADARELQRAIWMLEGELAYAANTFLAGQGINSAGDLATAAAVDATDGLNGVYALNLTTGSGPNISHRQDMLFFDDGGFRIPDGGLTVMMLGFALGGLGFFRRFVS